MGQAKIVCAVQECEQVKFIELFGYCSKGVPGLEIIGLGPKGRQVKEKLIFLVKEWRLKFPLKRFVICLEQDVKSLQLKAGSENWLELPILILFLELSDNLAIQGLENCMASGKIALDGEVESFSYSQEFWQQLSLILQEKKKTLCYIGSSDPLTPGVNHIDQGDLLNVLVS
jgi:hypothetical protein